MLFGYLLKRERRVSCTCYSARPGRDFLNVKPAGLVLGDRDM